MKGMEVGVTSEVTSEVGNRVHKEVWKAASKIIPDDSHLRTVMPLYNHSLFSMR